MNQSKLPREVLSKIWGLADRGKDGFLDLEEFTIAMYLMNTALSGYPVPNALPPSLQLPTQRQEEAPKELNLPPFGEFSSRQSFNSYN